MAMESSRRGFLGLMAGSAVAGKSGVAKIAAKLGAGSGAASVAGVAMSQGVIVPTAGIDPKWAAQNLLQLIKNGPSQDLEVRTDGAGGYPPNIAALRSVAPSIKIMMAAECWHERNQRRSIRELIYSGAFKYIPGMSEETIVSIVKQIAKRD